ncbi:hypothetical protein [uncultured Neptuniibacter sp.]|uniref:hypothetical protein n=1 Tax=uncultured Neptuniibacter sp. TaxID=502143 RepID=UPI002637D6B8|nr:hypothetical protein [uncultured Neptuniibacter sp.]
MFRHLLNFSLWLLAPCWMRNRTPDETHFYRRLFTAKHRAKRSKAKLLWISVLTVMLFFPYPPVVFTLFLFTTFLTFSLMDESN